MPRPAAPRGPAVLLAAAILASGALAVAAVLATVAHRRAVDRSLDRYATIAAWELGAHTAQALDRAVQQTLWPVRRFGVVDDDGFPPVTVLAAAAPEPDDCPCPLPFAARFFLRLDLDTGRLDTAGEALDPRQAGALRAALTHVPSARTGETRLRPWADGADTLFLAFAALPGRDGAPAAVYGAAVPPSAVAPVLSGPLAEAELLPASLTPGLGAGRLFRVRLLDSAGRTLFDSGDAEATDHRATAALGDGLGSLEVELALTRRAAEVLAPGAGTPPWMLACLLVAAVGLFWAAFRSLATERRLLATKERYVTALSHDLRTPLAQIRMFAETLRRGRDRSERERMRFAEAIELESRRLEDVIENALLVGRGTEPMPPSEPVDVGALARAETGRWARLVPDADLRVTGPPGLRVRARPDPLRRILANLIDNAVKYGPPGGPVEVAVEPHGRRRVRVRVSDRGPGIAPEDRDRVFRPFFRLAEGTGRAAGSGVGLAVVKELVEALGGSVWVEDARPSGAAFVVELERAAAEAGDPADGELDRARLREQAPGAKP